jgi:KDO2-lipid IV(A) lauroyltransferase
MSFTNLDVLEEYKQKGQSVIILSSHQFNWEWLLVSGSVSLPFPTDFVYQTVNNEFFDELALFSRTRFGAYPIKRDEVGRELIKRKNLQRGIAIIADQYPGLGKDKKYLATFLNQPTAFFQGANQIAILTQFPVVYAALRRRSRGYYTATFVKIGDPPFEKGDVSLIESYIRAVEENIRENPASWLWSHKRWKKRHLQED